MAFKTEADRLVGLSKKLSTLIDKRTKLLVKNLENDDIIYENGRGTDIGKEKAEEKLVNNLEIDKLDIEINKITVNHLKFNGLEPDDIHKIISDKKFRESESMERAFDRREVE